MNTSCKTLSYSRLLIWTAFPATVFVGFASLSCLALFGRNHNSDDQNIASSALLPFALEINPDPVPLGNVAPGVPRNAIFRLRNRGPQRVVVESIETSCPCVGVAPHRVCLEPGRDEAMTVTFDPTRDPDFRGSLCVELSGYGTGEKVVFRTRVKLSVSAD
jgi:hypothetical protein